ncbi:DNA-methyltransferase [Halanaeroarchaeum sulfurireducens]|uniref:Type II methyltransferase n=1 Tax=Halanaeroarchaeum sulfurireducens TaxID=1604004 RepID=A0A0F7P9T2_9EURY|nr:site-specific DNA-methyltransferase [Halanaeroarchaeum sulfurireducens]AKH96945.1 DNA methylase N-4/N-6 domain-containing protein [Halanaeroarchaeum sulfurireducens]ALG81346.1 DNA methylase N-4/N-6 domain-containing protein [Halanaeroarchaeum sulfurireducens]
METRHRVIVGDSRTLEQVDDDSIELVVTSPPYPMIEMWDDLFATMDEGVDDELAAGNGRAAFESMHDVLDEVWNEVKRVLVDGGIACVNVGDATRTVDGSFRVYQNHSRIIDSFERMGFEPLPEVLWRKPVNSAAKFMGSGMLPPNAYVTLEHEYILVFRNGRTRRRFEPGSDRRYDSAYFWEERNRWFSDVWTDVRGEHQLLENDELRDRSGAYPFEIPYRLINMYSIYGDTVLDPFWGTGTTSLAAMAAGRNSVGYELEEEFVQEFRDRVADARTISRAVIERRLADHRAFVADKLDAGDDFKYEAENYDFPVTTRQERSLQFYAVDGVKATDTGYRATHAPVEGDGFDSGVENAGGTATSLTDF